LAKLPKGSLLVIRALAKNNATDVAFELEKLTNKLLERTSRAGAK
jgi:hypothetical protein